MAFAGGVNTHVFEGMSPGGVSWLAIEREDPEGAVAAHFQPWGLSQLRLTTTKRACLMAAPHALESNCLHLVSYPMSFHLVTVALLVGPLVQAPVMSGQDFSQLPALSHSLCHSHRREVICSPLACLIVNEDLRHKARTLSHSE